MSSGCGYGGGKSTVHDLPGRCDGKFSYILTKVWGHSPQIAQNLPSHAEPNKELSDLMSDLSNLVLAQEIWIPIHKLPKINHHMPNPFFCCPKVCHHIYRANRGLWTSLPLRVFWFVNNRKRRTLPMSLSSPRWRHRRGPSHEAAVFTETTLDSWKIKTCLKGKSDSFFLL